MKCPAPEGADDDDGGWGASKSEMVDGGPVV
jgi:hypothetical protein